MSMQLSIYATSSQVKPTVEVMTDPSGYYHWLSIQYGDVASGHGLTFHGRSKAQCERLAAAWLAMWDEPAREFDENGMFKSPEDFGLAIHPEDGQPMEDAGLADELDDTTQEEISK